MRKNHARKTGKSGRIQSARVKKTTAKKREDEILTRNEQVVLKHLCDEKNSREIAKTMQLTEKRVEKIRGSLMLKTNARNLVGMVKYAIRNQIYNLR
jgi:DNA-binding CsgD family transcriptional regulator